MRPVMIFIPMSRIAPYPSPPAERVGFDAPLRAARAKAFEKGRMGVFIVFQLEPFDHPSGVKRLAFSADVAASLRKPKRSSKHWRGNRLDLPRRAFIPQFFGLEPPSGEDPAYVCAAQLRACVAPMSGWHPNLAE